MRVFPDPNHFQMLTDIKVCSTAWTNLLTLTHYSIIVHYRVLLLYLADSGGFFKGRTPFSQTSELTVKLKQHGRICGQDTPSHQLSLLFTLVVLCFFSLLITKHTVAVFTPRVSLTMRNVCIILKHNNELNNLQLFNPLLCPQFSFLLSAVTSQCFDSEHENRSTVETVQ